MTCLNSKRQTYDEASLHYSIFRNHFFNWKVVIGNEEDYNSYFSYSFCNTAFSGLLVFLYTRSTKTACFYYDTSVYL